MKLDRGALEAIAAMDDAQLAGVIRALAARSGVDAASLHLGAAELAAVRQALRSADAASVANLARGLGLDLGGL